MIDKVLALLQLKKELPDAVGFQTLGPVVFTLPEELRDKLPLSYREDFVDIKTSYLVIDNFSKKVQKNIRIIYSGDIGLTPDIEYQNRGTNVDFEHKPDAQEIHINEILPEESIVVSITNSDSEFCVERILISGEMITSTMNKLANAKRYPPLIWAYTLTTLVAAATVLTVYNTYKTTEENRLIAERMNLFYKNLGYSACQPEIFYNEIGQERELERIFNQLDDVDQSNTLIFNSVDSYEELKYLDEIVFCSFQERS